MTNQDAQQKGPVRKLGRGLSALLGTPVQIQAPSPAAIRPERLAAASRDAVVETRQDSVPVKDPGSEGIRSIAVAQIVPNRRQPRQDFDEAALDSLARSIKSAGLMQPVVVRPLDSGFELVAGERRWRAAKRIGLETIPAVIRDVDEQGAAELALIENIQREDLNAMERAIALRRLADDFSLTHQEIADKVGLDRTSVTNLLRLADLDSATASLVRLNLISQGHAKALLAIADPVGRSKLAQQVADEGWSVRELERRIQQLQRSSGMQREASEDHSPDEVTARDANVADLERQLAEYLGTKVAIQLGRKKGSGRLILDFYSLDQFDGLMQRMGFRGR